MNLIQLSQYLPCQSRSVQGCHANQKVIEENERKDEENKNIVITNEMYIFIFKPIDSLHGNSLLKKKVFSSIFDFNCFDVCRTTHFNFFDNSDTMNAKKEFFPHSMCTIIIIVITYYLLQFLMFDSNNHNAFVCGV